jgi:hypothetical protein
MVHNRLLFLMSVCLLGASAALADDVGFIDCSNHSEGTQVFAKASKTQDVVASVPCGERFTILIYGFIFSRVQTSDGKIGYVYSNLISVDKAASALQKSASAQVVTASEKTPVYRPRTSETTASAAQPNPAAPKQVQPAPTQVAPAPAAVSASNVTDTTATVAQPSQVASTQAAPAPSFASGSTVLEKTMTAAPPDPSSAAQPDAVRTESASAQTTTVQVASTEVAAAQTAPAQQTVTISNTPDRTAAVAQPDPPPPAQPEPARAEPAPAKPAPAEAVQPAPRAAEARASWERPLPPSVSHMPLIELFGGYSFARFDNGAGNPASNLNGAMGSFGYNFKPWLQIVGDTSYNFVTTNGVKNVIYGNHYGARYFYHKQNRWHLTPFVEALVGGSRADSTVSGAGGYKTSSNCISYKAGGGLDFQPSRRWEIRLLDVDYYRTSFGTNLHQNNYWASAGVVLRLFGGGRE